MPVSLAAALHLDAGFRLSSADIAVSLGAGEIGAGQDSVPIAKGGFSLHLTPSFAALTNGLLALAPMGHSAPHVGFSATAALDGQWTGKFHLTADAVQAADLHTYWPSDAAPHTRDWVTKNITAGTARNAVFDITLSAPRSLADVRLQDVTGRFDGQDLTLTWLPRARPLTGLNGTMVFEDRDTAVITASSAKFGALAVTGGQMTIVGLDHHDQTGNLNVSLAGTVPGDLCDAERAAAQPAASCAVGDHGRHRRGEGHGDGQHPVQEPRAAGRCEFARCGNPRGYRGGPVGSGFSFVARRRHAASQR